MGAACPSRAEPIRRFDAWWAGMHAGRIQHGNDSSLTRVQLIQSQSAKTPSRRLPALSPQHSGSVLKLAARFMRFLVILACGIFLIIIFSRRSSLRPPSRARMLPSHKVIKLKARTAVALIVLLETALGMLRARG